MLKIWQKIGSSTAAVIAAILIGSFLFSFYPPSREKCVICSHAYSHAPALLNINTGRIDTLNVYDYSYYDPTVPAKYQRGGYMTILPFEDFFGTRWTNPWYIDVTLPEQTTAILNRSYCKSCLYALSECQNGFAILDLGEPDIPAIYAVENGNAFSFRCYDIAVSENKLTVIGILELPEDNDSYMGEPIY